MSAISSSYNNVYNYYMSSQMHKQQTNKYDAHKKSELRGIYNSIVKMSKDSPVYIFDRSRQAMEYAINIKEEARSLKNTLSALDSEGDAGSLLGQKVAVSSDEDAVSVRYLGKRGNLEDDTRLEISVDQLATPQVNTGNYLAQNRLKLIPNNYSFDIQCGGLSYGFQFRVTHQDTNHSIQERLANLITKSNIGVQAQVVTDETTGFSSLQLISKSTGNDNDSLWFHVTEEDGSPNSGAVTYFGLNQVSDMPANAEFQLNGEQHTALSNTFTINQDFELTLHHTTPKDQPAVIGFQPDIDTVNDNIQEMTRKYNSIIRLSGSYAEEQVRSSLLGKNISSVARQYGNSLEAIGLLVSDDGSIEVDDQLLNQALSEDMTETVDSLMDFKSALSDKTDEVMLNPMDYVDKKIVAYPNPGKMFANPYLTSIYSGMLFNSYC